MGSFSVKLPTQKKSIKAKDTLHNTDIAKTPQNFPHRTKTITLGIITIT
jgi:hypothetical protein